MKYTLKVHTQKPFIVSGSLKELNERFLFNLLCGQSLNPKIKIEHKSITSLVRAINQSSQATRKNSPFTYFTEVVKSA